VTKVARLDFTTVALDAFAYLISNFGFVTTISDPEHVRFEGNGVFVSVRFDGRRSYELGVELGLLRPLYGGRERRFTLGEVLRLAGAAEEKDLATAIVTEQVALERFTSEMAACLEKYGCPLLRGQQDAFEQLGSLSDRESSEYQRRNELRFAIENALRAWKEGNYVRVVAELGPVEPDLLPSDRKRLAIARTRIP
jgi:hypothetical protein